MYQSLIIFLNRRCTVGCTTCNVNAQPENKAELNLPWLNSFFAKLHNQEPIFSGYILWTGGEPFLSFNSLVYGIEQAARLGYKSEILTSANWYQSSSQHLEILRSIDKPVIRISLDIEHQQQVPIKKVIALIEHALALGLEVNFTIREIPGLRKLTESPQHSLEIIKKELPLFYQENYKRSRWLHTIPHIPIPGKLSASSITDKPGNSTRVCQMAFRDLVIGEDGLIYPCCGFFSLPGYRKLTLGDSLTVSWKSLQRTESDYKYHSPCHVCIRIVENKLKLMP